MRLPALTLLLILSSLTFAAPKSKKPGAPLELSLKASDVAEVALAEERQANVIDAMKDGKVVPGGHKLYDTAQEFISFYSVSVVLAPEAAKKLDELTTANPGKKLVIKLEGKKLADPKISAPIRDGRLKIDLPAPKYDPKSDGTKESAQSKANAEKLLADIQKRLKKKP
jgi:preprotein translocase subunit SecD